MHIKVNKQYKHYHTKEQHQDHTLRNRIIIILAALLLILIALWGITLYGGQPIGYLGSQTIDYFKSGIDKIVAWGTGTSNESIRGRVADMYVLLNETRAEYGLYPLKVDSYLESLAQSHAESMYERGELDHLGYEERSMSVKAKGYKITSENAVGGVNNYAVSAFMESWMGSPGHRANILSNRFTHVGAGVYGNYAILFFAGY